MADSQVGVDPADVIGLVQRLLDLLEATSVAELEVQYDGLRVEIHREAVPSDISAATEADFAAPSAPSVAPGDAGILVKSGHVGYFHRPTDAPLPVAGDTLTAGTRIAEVEVLGIRNPVLAPIDGVLVEVLVEDDTPVEYGHILAVMHPRPER